MQTDPFEPCLLEMGMGDSMKLPLFNTEQS